MKIIIVGTAYPYRGGLATFNERIAKEYQDTGHDVEIYTFTLQYPSFLFPGKTQFSEDPAPEDLKIYRKINSINPFNWLKVGREIKAKRPDLVIFCYWMSFMSPCFGTIAKMISRDKHIKSIALVHNLLPHEPSIIDKVLPQYFVRQMDGFITLSKSVINDINRFDKKNKLKIYSPHPIYDHYGKLIPQKEALEELALDPSGEYILFFGIVREYKGLDLLLHAVADQRIKGKNIHLIIAGEFYGNENSYRNLIKKLGIEEQVVLCANFIPNDKVFLYFSAADIVAQPYKSATQSGVTQIAYHFEKPMLVTDVGGLAEIVPHQKVGYVVQPDEKEIANALIDFFENNRGEEFLPNIVAEKEKYSWRKMLESMDDLMKQIKQ